VAEYKALHLCLNMDKDMGIKILKIVGDSDLVVKQVKEQSICEDDRLKMYRITVWDVMELFDALSLEVQSRIFTDQSHALEVAA
jgi:ribonuclease HI